MWFLLPSCEGRHFVRLFIRALFCFSNTRSALVCSSLTLSLQSSVCGALLPGWVRPRVVLVSVCEVVVLFEEECSELVELFVNA